MFTSYRAIFREQILRSAGLRSFERALRAALNSKEASERERRLQFYGAIANASFL